MFHVVIHIYGSHIAISYHIISIVLHVPSILRRLPGQWDFQEPAKSDIFRQRSVPLKKGYLKYSLTQSFEIPSGKHLHNYGKIHHFQWVNPLFRLGHFLVRYATNYQRVWHQPHLLWFYYGFSMFLFWPSSWFLIFHVVLHHRHRRSFLFELRIFTFFTCFDVFGTNEQRTKNLKKLFQAV